MNYEHLKRCIESAPVPPMSRHLYDNMVKLIPIQLSVKYADVLSELHDEITVEYENTMRKARGNSNSMDMLCSLSVCVLITWIWTGIQYEILRWQLNAIIDATFVV